jgi:cytoskeletal protein CcmA (bactofilin family)
VATYYRIKQKILIFTILNLYNMGFFSSNKDKNEVPQPTGVKPLVSELPPKELSTPTPSKIGNEAATTNNNYNTNNQSNQPQKTNPNMTIIAAGTIIEGQMKVDTDIQIEGVIKGTITSKNKVILGVNGKVDGDINCQEADISGKVTGKIIVKDILFLKGAASVDGDIVTGKLVMESGVKFNGKCNMTGSMNIPPATPTPPNALNNNATPEAKVNA